MSLSLFPTKRQNKLYCVVWKLFSYSSTGAPVLLPCAMLPGQATGTHTKPTLQFTLSLGTFASALIARDDSGLHFSASAPVRTHTLAIVRDSGTYVKRNRIGG